MEGIIPMVYKAIMKNKSRRKYEYLSSDVARPLNITDFYLTSAQIGYEYDISTPSEERTGGSLYADAGPDVRTHKRCRSVGAFSTTDDLSYGAFTSLPHVQQKPQLMRFRSHRMFSCVTGA